MCVCLLTLNKSLSSAADSVCSSLLRSRFLHCFQAQPGSRCFLPFNALAGRERNPIKTPKWDHFWDLIQDSFWGPPTHPGCHLGATVWLWLQQIEPGFHSGCCPLPLDIACGTDGPRHLLLMQHPSQHTSRIYCHQMAVVCSGPTFYREPLD